ncbi:MAG TPA: hypothetical protein EYO76_01310, partial [Flavobacteriaceae bacterium]|nr:hypothetical protein [Flavobacteriaceae bacterium]
MAANKTRIQTFGTRQCKVQFGQRQFSVNFTLADVAQPLLGADFFDDEGLCIDVKGRRLIDPATLAHVSSVERAGTLDDYPGLASLHMAENRPADCPAWRNVLGEFPAITRPLLCTREVVKHKVRHYVTTVGPPVHARARRLAPDKLAIAKAEFDKMLELGIIRRSNSPWASPLHVVPKADGGWRPCGDYRRLNEATTPDRYPVPNIQDFSAELAGKHVFSKVDLVRGYNQIPMA